MYMYSNVYIERARLFWELYNSSKIRCDVTPTTTTRFLKLLAVKIMQFACEMFILFFIYLLTNRH